MVLGGLHDSLVFQTEELCAYLKKSARGDCYFSFYFEFDPWQNGQSDPIRRGNSNMADA